MVWKEGGRVKSSGFVEIVGKFLILRFFERRSFNFNDDRVELKYKCF